MKHPSENRSLSQDELCAFVDDIAEQMSAAIDGDFDIMVKVDVTNDTIEKLQVMVNLVLDATRRALRQVKDAQLMLVHSEKMAALGRLVSGILHELNTPVGAMVSSSDTLNRCIERLVTSPAVNTDSDGLAKVVRGIEQSNRIMCKSSERIGSVVRQLRSFARHDEADRQWVDLRKALDDTIALLAFDLHDGIQIKKNYGDIPRLLCYPAQLNQVFLNLLMNAREALGESGEIVISTVKKGGEICISISDNGKGISPEVLNKLFEPEFTTRDNRIAMGLGLPICYKIVQDHKGRITIDSEPGQGATFKVFLPISR